MTPICNDHLTRVRQGRVYKFTQLERTYRVGDRGDKNGMPYTIKAFGMNCQSLRRLREGEDNIAPSVWMLVKYRGDKRHKWDSLLIGDTPPFRNPSSSAGCIPTPPSPTTGPRIGRNPSSHHPNSSLPHERLLPPLDLRRRARGRPLAGRP